MKKRMLFSLCMIVILALTLISASPVAARALKTPVCSIQTNLPGGDPGRQWVDSGNVLHIRGEISYASIAPLSGPAQCDSTYSSGTLQTTVNVDLNLTTYNGAAWGMSTLTPAGTTDTFVGPYAGRIQGGVMTAQSIAFGTGKLKGLIELVSIQQTGGTTYEVHGYVLAP
jgi:hypothetical protein